MRIIAMQEIARAGCGGVGAGLFSHTIGAPPILHRGSEAMKARVLPQILSGEKISALAITEPSGGSDVANLRTTARRDGDHYVINGSKTFITSGMRADFITLAVRTGGPGASGVSLILIEGQPEGLQRTSLKKMGWWCSDTATLYFENVRVPGGEPDRQGGRGIPRHHAQLQRRAAAWRGGRDRGGAGLPRGGGRLRQGARDLRQADRPASGHPSQARRHGDEDRSLAGDAGIADLAARAGREPGRGNLHAEEPGDDHARLLRLRGRADFRRRGLLARRQGRAHLSRGEGQRHRRRARKRS